MATGQLDVGTSIVPYALLHDRPGRGGCIGVLPMMSAGGGGLYLRQWSVPFDALAEVALGRPLWSGPPSNAPRSCPSISSPTRSTLNWRDTSATLSTTVAGGCLLGASVTPSASTEALEAAYGGVRRRGAGAEPCHSPKTVCTDVYRRQREKAPLATP